MTTFPDIIILAGGLGTRLQSVVKELPKPMASVCGKPFLHWLLDYLYDLKPNKFILSTGYKHEAIEDYFGSSFQGIPIVYGIESEPLGTGGGIKKAMMLSDTEHCLVLNGDTFLRADHRLFMDYHLERKALFTMALKTMENPYRYGTVEVSQDIIQQFNEKNPELSKGLINTGVYALSKKVFEYFPPSEKFSFEKDFIEVKTEILKINSFVTDSYFIDIGIPEDYNKANEEFPLLFY